MKQTKQLTAVDLIIEIIKKEQKKPKLTKKEWRDIFKLTKAIQAHQIIEAAKWMPKPYETLEFLPELAVQYYKEKYK